MRYVIFYYGTKWIENESPIGSLICGAKSLIILDCRDEHKNLGFFQALCGKGTPHSAVWPCIGFPALDPRS